MTIALGLFSLGLVLGWAALFARAGWRRGALGRIGWLAALTLVVAFAPQPGVAAAGIGSGILAHLLLQLGLEERRA